MASSFTPSPYLVAIIASFVIVQLFKTVMSFWHHKDISLIRRFFVSGGLPSSHSATIMAVWMVILLKDGWNSGLFGLASAVALIVLYDAVKVRRSSGEQGIAVWAIIKELHSTIPLPRVAMGHTPFQVLIGSIVGILIGWGAVVLF